jgi:CRISPR-associated endonuclease Csn1
MDKIILGLDLGSTSIGWALVKEIENADSEIIRTGVRVIPLTTDEQGNFEKGKAITTNQDRTSSRSARRNLQRYKLRRTVLIKVLKENGIINDDTIFSEEGKNTSYQTLELRAKAASEKISKEEFARVLLTINKKRGYKSSRKAKNDDEGQLIDGMEVAMKLYDENLTPGQYCLELLQLGKKSLPDFYRSDLQNEFDKIWEYQKKFHKEILTDEFKGKIKGKGQRATSAIFWTTYNFNTAENKGNREEKKLQAYKWRSEGFTKELAKEEVAYVLTEINNDINKSSGYLGDISDRSKELYFNKQTVGQYLYKQIQENRHTRLKGQVFYRKDYEDEFDAIWNEQAKHYKELTAELKTELKDICIFYQRRLKSQKGLISTCELESREREIIIDGKKKTKLIGPKVSPKSSPLFQEFRIWQRLNDLEVWDKKERTKWRLDEDSKKLLFQELNIIMRLKKEEVLKLLYKNHKELDLNFKELDGNRTNAALFEVYKDIVEKSGHGEHDFGKISANEVVELVESVFKTLGINTEILKLNTDLEGKEFEKQAAYQFWHLLYSYEGDDSKTGDESLINILKEKFGFEKEYAQLIAKVTFEPDYGSLSSKAISKILPHLKDGFDFSESAGKAGYNHSKSLNKEELANRELKDKLEILDKNSLRNPVVEKILNQTIHVVNAIIEEYGKPHEIRLELARELKKSAKEREDATKNINRVTLEHEKYKELLKKEFGLSYVSKNDLIRYKLYKELEPNGFKTLYSNTYISADKLFSKEFDIEHIIPQSRMFDDSFSNKTLELRSINIEKGDKTAYDYVLEKYGEKGLQDYEKRVEDLFKNVEGRKGKLNKLLKKSSEIQDGFIDRDLRNSQYIAKKAKEMLQEVCRTVNTTTGVVTSRLREDWQLVDVLQELNWEKYEKLGLTYYETNREGKKLPRITDWTKRNDHRHHAMDALTVAFTRYSHVQYLNYLNARKDENNKEYSKVIGIEKKELYKDERNKLRFNPPMELKKFRAEAKKHLENTLISFKAKNKVVTPNKNKVKGSDKAQKTLTPRGQLHLETVYGSIKQYETKEVKVAANFDLETINKVAKQSYRNALLKRLEEFDNDPKKAFTGKNSLEKNPVYINEAKTQTVPDKVKLVSEVTIYTIRKPISPDLKIDKVVDVKIRQLLENRLKEYNNDSKKAFSNLDEFPIWLNKEKGIEIKSVTITGISNAVALHDKKDKNGNLILDKNGSKQAVDFVNTGNNHHVAIYRDEKGSLQEKVVSFYEAVLRINQDLPAIDKLYNREKGWQFLFTLKQNEYFVFPNEKTGFNPFEIDLMDMNNYKLISPNLFRVQKISTKNYMFTHHLETQATSGETLKNKKELSKITYNFIQTPSNLENIIKVRINHLGSIVHIGEY